MARFGRTADIAVLCILLSGGCRVSAEIDWAGTGAMLGGIGALLAVLGTIFIVVLTWKYVRIYADLLNLNRESLDALQQSVAASRAMAKVMEQQTIIAGAESASRIVREHEPFRHLLERMKDGVQRVIKTDLVHVYHEAVHDRQPQTSWFLPPDYREKVEAAQNLDGRLHALLASLNEPPDGALSKLQLALGKVSHDIRMEYTEVPKEGWAAASHAQDCAHDALEQLREILVYVNERQARELANR